MNPEFGQDMTRLKYIVLYTAYSKTPIYRGHLLSPFPRIVHNMYNVNKQTPIYRKPRITADVSFPQTPR